MPDDTKIQWTDATWNPIRGCSRISPGCGGPNKEGGCYAEKIAARFSGAGKAFEGYAHYVNGEARWTGKMGLIESMLDQPLRWKRPRRIFTNSMSDLFHENLPDESIDQVFAVMGASPQHTLQILTKRSDRMRAYLSAPDVAARWFEAADSRGLAPLWGPPGPVRDLKFLPNVWVGVSVEDQRRADERIHDLLWTPAAKRFISAEPLLGTVNLTRINDVGTVALDALRGIRVTPPLGEPIDLKAANRLDWVIVGGESGSRPRGLDMAWARAIVAQCKGAGVACFVKQLGAKPYQDGVPGVSIRTQYPTTDKKGGEMADWPVDLRVREFPA